MHEMLPSCNCRRTVWTGPGSSGERPFPLQSYVKLGPIRKVEREAQACLSGPRGPLLQSWTAVAVPARERRGSSGRHCGPSAVGAGQESPLGLPQEPGLLPASTSWFTPSCLRVQGPQPCGRRHRGDRLSPPRPGLCDERAGHVEEVGGWSPPG